MANKPMFIQYGTYVPPAPPQQDIYIKIGELTNSADSNYIYLNNYTDRYQELSVDDFYIMISTNNMPTPASNEAYFRYNFGKRIPVTRAAGTTSAPTFYTYAISGYAGLWYFVSKSYYPDSNGMMAWSLRCLGKKLNNTTETMNSSTTGTASEYFVDLYRPNIYLVVCKSFNNRLYGFDTHAMNIIATDYEVDIAAKYPSKYAELLSGDAFYDLVCPTVLEGSNYKMLYATNTVPNTSKANWTSTVTSSTGRDAILYAETSYAAVGSPQTYPVIDTSTAKIKKIFPRIAYTMRTGPMSSSGGYYGPYDAREAVADIQIKPYIYLPQT